jgi:uncharacterized RDD family membrane protein YckC
MSCPLCGDACRCSSEPKRDRAQSPCVEQFENNGSGSAAAPDSQPWRAELAARLNRYQSRRKPRPPRYPSLCLRFEDAAGAGDQSASDAAVFLPASHHALALDGFADESDPQAQPPVQVHSHLPHGSAFSPARASNGSHPVGVTSSSTGPTAKIIEFPRSWTSPAPPLDELAEPVISGPRILEVPEVVPPPPALGGITIETPQQAEIERRPGIDFPLQGASLSRRILAAVLDDLIIAAAGALFGFIFWKMTSLRPPRLEIGEIAAGSLTVFWTAFQYLLIVYSGSTPGLRLARLRIARFDGSSTSRRLRRWRVLASFLSAISLGMGYVWVSLDEDSLCWHDRITHTCLAPRSRK